MEVCLVPGNDSEMRQSAQNSPAWSCSHWTVRRLGRFRESQEVRENGSRQKVRSSPVH